MGNAIYSNNNNNDNNNFSRTKELLRPEACDVNEHVTNLYNIIDSESRSRIGAINLLNLNTPYSPAAGAALFIAALACAAFCAPLHTPYSPAAALFTNGLACATISLHLRRR
jgi:hypothetical protein